MLKSKLVDDGEIKLDFRDVRIAPSASSSVSSRSKVSLVKTVSMPHSMDTFRVNGGIIASNMDGVGTLEMANALANKGCMTALRKHYSDAELIDFFSTPADETGFTPADYAFMTIGLNDYDRFVEVDAAVRANNGTGIRSVCVDVANGHMSAVSDLVRLIRHNNTTVTIMAGNIGNADGIAALANAGADIIKVGIGSGAMCTTRLVAGVGVPQLSLLSECVAAADVYGVAICSDGGCVTSGDVAIALAVGADFVMLGTMLAGTTEGGTKPVGSKKGDVVEFYGMSSSVANGRYNSGLSNYKASEGRLALVSYVGDVSPHVDRILGGIRSACAYSDVFDLDTLPYVARLVRVNSTHNTSHENNTIGN